MADAGIRMKNSAHPGGFVKTEIIEPLGLTVTDAAAALGVGRQTFSEFLNEHTKLTPEMALRLEKAFGLSMDTLMRMQTSYEIAQTRRRDGDITVKRYVSKPKKKPHQRNLV
jgi:antitoxin HigA-1